MRHNLIFHYEQLCRVIVQKCPIAFIMFLQPVSTAVFPLPLSPFVGLCCRKIRNAMHSDPIQYISSDQVFNLDFIGQIVFLRRIDSVLRKRRSCVRMFPAGHCACHKASIKLVPAAARAPSCCCSSSCCACHAYWP